MISLVVHIHVYMKNAKEFPGTFAVASLPHIRENLALCHYPNMPFIDQHILPVPSYMYDVRVAINEACRE